MQVGTSIEASVRLDLWLWAARFFKTRTLAKVAVAGGKIRVNAEPCKPAKAIRVGDLVQVGKTTEQIDVRILALAEQRGSASIAATLYEELPESLTRRMALREHLKLMRAGYSAPPSKPDKRSRRHIHAFLDQALLDQTAPGLELPMDPLQSERAR